MRVELKQWLRSHWGDMTANDHALFPQQTLYLQPGGAGIASMRGQYEQWLQILMMVSGLVLLIVCANIANLILVRGMERRQQISLSMALGAQAPRLVRQSLTESILLSLLGGAAGLVIAFAGTRLILHFAFPRVGDMAGVPISASPSMPVLLFAFGVSLIAGAAFGIAPAWMATRVDPSRDVITIPNARGSSFDPSATPIEGATADTLQSRATRQVSIQARVIEVELNDEFSSGIDWTLLMRRAGGSVSLAQEVLPSGGSRPFTAVLNIKDFPGLLTALGAQGRANVMATPHVNALNNEPAIMRVGTQDVFFRTTSQVDAAGRTLHTVEPLAVVEGVLLGVTPQISGDGMITLSITPSLTERTGQAVSRFGDAVPILRIREADTLVRVRENETVVIAGLMGTRAKRKTDLVILLTSTIVTPARAPLASARAGASLSE